ncbi:uncharacterized protein LOC116852388 [Odontomachus brunneus]|uniref:uncharacterized protein LOC116852388 n=1 Tax=Odontomachus brunneus TaxID=486640 RepID=UPI0013F1CE5F|nr:uncharacterized protein LOC116852388 [Odontomachus brunneus]
MDIGNFVFNCGQVYVALSRVTSIEGLHLINCDPSLVKASEEAIIEYNRLKKVHKAKTALITVSKKKHHKVKDILWTSPKIVSRTQVPCKKFLQNTAWVIKGFQNTDCDDALHASSLITADTTSVGCKRR